MEDKYQNTKPSYSDGGVVQVPQSSLSAGTDQPVSSNALSSFDSVPSSQYYSQGDPPESKPNLLVRLVKRADVILAILLVLSMIGVFVATSDKKSQQTANQNGFISGYETQKIPLDDFSVTAQGLNFGSSKVIINGIAELNNGLVVTPSLQPSGPTAGQIYYDQNINQLAYYNGEEFIPVGTGVTSVQGLTGAVNLIAGAGIAINGTTISSTITSGGAGTVGGPGGTPGSIAKFTGAQTIADSLLSESGTTLTLSGDLTVTGAVTLGTALGVTNGGTGAATLAANGVLVGNGTSPITSVIAGGVGQCLLSTAGAPAFAPCPGGGGGVSSLNGQTGIVVLANASGALGTVTIDDGSTTQKGIVQFNATNFSGSGTINTIQNINTGATPTFAGVNTNSITPSAALTVGVSGQTALLQGSTTTITSSGAGNDIVLNSADTIELQDNTNVTGNIVASGDIAVNGGDLTSTGALNITPTGALTAGVSTQTLTLQGNASTSLRATNGANTTIVGFTSPTANTTLNFPALSAGTYTICTTSGNCAGAGVTLQAAYDNSSTPEIVLDATRAALTIRDTLGGLGTNLLEVQNNGGGTTYLAVTATGTTVTGTATVTGSINSSGGALQTGGTTRVDNTGNLTNIGSLALSGSISGGTTISGSGNINTTGGGIQTNSTTRIDNSGNLTNIGGLTLSGAISGGTTYSGSGNINTTGGVIQTNSTTRIDNSGNLTNIAAITASGSATLQGGSVTLGTTTQAGSVVISDGSSNTGTLQVAALGSDRVYTFPDATGTVCLSTGNCAGSGGGVTTPGGTTDRVPKFTGAQTIGDSSITDNGTTVTTTVDLVIQGGDATIGVASSQTGTLNFAHSGSAFLGSIVQGALTGSRTYTLPDVSGTFCLTSGNCSGSGSSSTLQAAYDAGNSITTTNNRDIDIVLANTATDSNLDIVVADDSTSFVVISRADGAGTNDPAQLLLLDNLDTNRAVSVGLKLQAAAGGLTTAIDASDAEIGDALSVGANNIVGTTGNIDFSNFDVTGSNGNVAAGLYNGQTISATANFTGTLAVTGNTTLTGDIAVNGGDVTSTGALTITSAAAGNITLNSAGTIELQDNTNVTGAFSTTSTISLGALGSTDTAAYLCRNTSNLLAACNTTGAGAAFVQGGNSFGATAVLGTNDNNGLSLEINNGVVASFSTAGAANFVNNTNSTQAFNIETSGGANLLTVDTTNFQVGIGLGGNNVPGLGVGSEGLQVNGALLVSGSGSSTWTTFTTPNSTPLAAKVAIDVQGLGGFGQVMALGADASSPNTARVLSLFDSRATAHQATLAVFSPDENSIVGFNWNGSNAAALVGTSDIATGNTDAVILQSGNVTAGNGSSGEVIVTSGSIAGGTGGSTGLVTIQSGNGAGTDSNSGNVIVDAGSKTGTGTAGTITVGGTNASALTLGRSGLTTTNAGNLVIQGGTNTVGTTSQQGSLVLHDGNGQTATISVGSALTASTALAIPTAVGASDTFCLLTLANCVGTGGGIAGSGTTNRTAKFTASNTIGNSSILDDGSSLTVDSNVDIVLQGATAFISNAQGLATSAFFGSGATFEVGSTANVTVVGSGSKAGDRSVSFGSSINNTANDSVAIGHAVNITSASAIAIGSGASAGSEALAIGDGAAASSASSIAFGFGATTTAANQLVIGSNDSTTHHISHVVIGSGVTDTTPNGFTLQGTSGSGADVAGASVTIAGGQGTGTGNGGSINFQIADPGTTGSSLNALATVFSLSGVDGAALLKNTTNSATAFQIQDTAAAGLFTVDTTARSGSGGNLIKIGNSTGTDAALTILKLDSTTADPTSNLAALNGGLFYNSTTHKVSLVENGVVKIICNTTDLGCGTGTVTLQSAYGNGNTINTTNNSNIAFNLTEQTTDPNFLVDLQCDTSCGANGRFAVQDDGTDVFSVSPAGGAVLAQNQTNSANAFRILNSTGGELFGANTTSSILRLLNNNNAEIVTGGWTTNSNNLPDGRFSQGTATYDGYVYVVGGNDNADVQQDEVYYARLNANGSIGTWAATTALPQVREELTAVAANGYLYAIGGRNGSSVVQTTVYYAKINADGTVGSWNTTTALPTERARHTSVTANGYLYLMGGDETGGTVDKVHYARLNSDGTLGAWSSTNTFGTALHFHSSVVANGYVYALGGNDGITNFTAVRKAKLNTDGTLGAWSTTTALPNTRINGASAVLNGYLYHLGGDGSVGDYGDVFYAPLNSDGTIGSWTQTTDMNITRRSLTAFTSNGYLYAVGGENGSARTEVEYASPARVTIGGSLDLVSLAGENLAEGGSGGALTAGNTHIAGLLTVTDSALLKGGATVNNNLTVQAQTNASSVFSVLSASASELVGVDTVDSMLRLLGNNTGHLASFATGSSLSAASSGGHAVAVDGYIYLLGGFNSSNARTTTVHSARVNSNGSTNTWGTTTALPVAQGTGAAATYNGYIYVNGGNAAAADGRDVFYAKINQDGTITSWVTLNDVLASGQDREDHTMVAYNGFLYIIGGEATGDGADNRNISYARINADGSLGTFSTSTNWLPAASLGPRATVANGYLYVLGESGDTVYYGKINADGTVAAATTETDTLAGNRDYSAFGAMNGYLYVVGGGGSGTNTVYYSALDNNGNLNAWATDSTTLPANRWGVGAAITNGYIYVIGGDDSGAEQSTVYYASGARVKVGGGLDLVGYSGESMAEGSTGGSLTAGNTHIAGVLSVTGAALFKDGLSSLNGVSITTANNSTAALAVMNAAGVPQFSVDTTNSRVYIGNTSNDSTGALFVLDSINNASDPSGVDGAMYYNSNMAMMRCYYDAKWRFCNDEVGPEWGYSMKEDFIATLQSTPGDEFGVFAWTYTGTTGDASVDTVAATDAKRPGILRLTTGTGTTNASALHISQDGGNEPFLIGAGDEIEFAMNIATLSTASGGGQEYDIRAGLCDSVGECVDGVYFEYDRDTSANWIIGSVSNTTNKTETTTSTAVAAAGWHRFKIVVNSTSNVEYFIDGTSVGTITTAANIPTTRATSPMFHIVKETGGTARTFDVDYFYMHNSFATRRGP